MAVQKTPDRGDGKDMPLFSQTVADFHQRQITLFVNPLQNPGGMGLRTMAVMVTANSIGINAAGALETLIPAY